MAQSLYIFNSRCLKDGKVEEEMVKVGPMIFCKKCFTKEFIETEAYDNETGIVPSDSKEYKKWLVKYKKL